MSELCANQNLRIHIEACEGLSCESGEVNSGRFGQLKKNLRRIVNEPPSAMLEQHRNLVTYTKGLEELALNTYIDRLKALDIKEEFKLYQVQKEQLCKEILKEAQAVKIPNRTMNEPNMVLKQLKNNKSSDPSGFANELFKP